MMNKIISIIGSGQHAHVVLDALEQASTVPSVCIYDENPSRWGVKIWHQYPIQNIADFNPQTAIHIGVGDNHFRQKIALKHRIPPENMLTIIHPKATISRHAHLAQGCFVAANAIIATGSQIGVGCIVNHGAIVDHDCIIDDWCHIAPGVTLGGSVAIGEGTLIGAGAVVLKGVHIGHRVVVGAGAVVTRNIPDDTTVIGIPAKKREQHESF